TTMLTHPIRVGGDATPGLSRRELLQGAGVLFGTLWVSSGTLLALAPSRAWALELKTFDANTGKSLLMLTRNIYPHDKLDDAVYALVVKDLDAEAGT
ncbi:MAG: tat (twin-arginine translocation) pathway signal sequence, partial [Betaproteobacteria bacterium]